MYVISIRTMDCSLSFKLCELHDYVSYSSTLAKLVSPRMSGESAAVSMSRVKGEKAPSGQCLFIISFRWEEFQGLYNGKLGPKSWGRWAVSQAGNDGIVKEIIMVPYPDAPETDRVKSEAAAL